MPVAVGNTTIKLAVGNTPLSAAYVGSQQVFSSAPPAGPFDPLSIPWASAFWAEDPAQTTHPPDGTSLPGAPTWHFISNQIVGNWQRYTATGPNYYAAEPTLNGKPAIGVEATGGTNMGLRAPTGISYGGVLTMIVIGFRNRKAGDNMSLAENPDMSRWPPGEGVMYQALFGSQNTYFLGDYNDTDVAHLWEVVFPNTPAKNNIFIVDGVDGGYHQQSGEQGGVALTNHIGGHGTSKWRVGFYGTIDRELTTAERANLLAWSRSHYGTP
jgi:hypothetical protein